jgi:hypothetical protein
MDIIRVKRKNVMDLSGKEIDSVALFAPKKVVTFLDLSKNAITELDGFKNIRSLCLDYNCIHDLTPVFSIPGLRGLSLVDAIGYPGRVSDYNSGPLSEPVLSDTVPVCADLEVLTLGNITPAIMKLIFPTKKKIIGNKLRELIIYGPVHRSAIPLRIKNSCEVLFRDYPCIE